MMNLTIFLLLICIFMRIEANEGITNDIDIIIKYFQRFLSLIE